MRDVFDELHGADYDGLSLTFHGGPLHYWEWEWRPALIDNVYVESPGLIAAGTAPDLLGAISGFEECRDEMEDDARR